MLVVKIWIPLFQTLLFILFFWEICFPKKLVFIFVLFLPLQLSICFLCYVYLLFQLQNDMVRSSPGLVISMFWMPPQLGLEHLSLRLGSFLFRCYWIFFFCDCGMQFSIFIHDSHIWGFLYVPDSTNFYLYLVISFLCPLLYTPILLSVFRSGSLSFTLSILLRNISLCASGNTVKGPPPPPPHTHTLASLHFGYCYGWRQPPLKKKLNCCSDFLVQLR